MGRDFYKILNYSDKLWQRGIESENLKDFFCYLLLLLVGNPYQCLVWIIHKKNIGYFIKKIQNVSLFLMS